MTRRIFLFAILYSRNPSNFFFCVKVYIAKVSCKTHAAVQADAFKDLVLL